MAPDPKWTLGERDVSVPPLAPCRQHDAAFHLLVRDPVREILALRVRLTSAGSVTEVPVQVPFFRDAPQLGDVRTLDGASLKIWKFGDTPQVETLGKGNGDGRANRGETIASAVPDAGAYRPLELFTNDPCVDNSKRLHEIRTRHEGQISHFSLARIKPRCEVGQEIPFFCRWVVPGSEDHTLHEGVVRIRVR
jgi:hypothetical protein